jgi:transcriptional regulator with XRE-family HTH domain
MNLRKALGLAIRRVRKSRGLSQEAFDSVSSRTYLSTLERGIKNATLDKLDEIACVMEVHPAALVCLAYATKGKQKPEIVIDEIAAEAKRLLDLPRK